MVVLSFNVFAVLQAKAGSFHETSPMATVRCSHSMTMLSNGDVMAAGGANNYTTDNGVNKSATNSVEIYNPSNGTWKTTGALNVGRAYHTATLFPDGRVLIVGGGSYASVSDAPFAITLSSAELYDPSSGTWTTTGNLNAARIYHTATLLPNGAVLVVGGCKMSGNDPPAMEYYDPSNKELFPPYAELYSPSDGTWTITGALDIGRVNHTATLLTSGKVLVVGGGGVYPPWGGIFSSAELYDPSNGTWTATGSLITARESHTATLLPDGKVLVTGGIGYSGGLSSAELYDPATGKWTQTGSLKAARAQFTATLLSNGNVLVAGGWKVHTMNPLSSAELYNPLTGTWGAAGSMKTGRLRHAAVLLRDGRALITGGGSYHNGVLSHTVYSDFVSLSKAELFDPTVGRTR